MSVGDTARFSQSVRTISCIHVNVNKSFAPSFDYGSPVQSMLERARKRESIYILNVARNKRFSRIYTNKT